MSARELGRNMATLVVIACLGLGCLPERPGLDAEAPEGAASAVPPIAPAPKLEAEAEAEAEPTPEPELVPAPFAGREIVRVDELLAAVSVEVEAIAASELVRRDYEAFLDRFELSDRPELYLDYVRVRIAFEATRAGGLWGLAWDITNKKPNSEEIWARWRAMDREPAAATVDELAPLPTVTAIAECDELSALFAYVAQRIGLSRASEVGLFWPGDNHTVAVWTIEPKSDEPVRVVIPTSQIFLDEAQSLGTDGFNPWKQRKIFDYRREDAAPQLELPAWLASRFVLEIRERGALSQAELQRQRNALERRQHELMVDVAGQTR